MSLLAQTIGQILEIEFFQILPFWAFFTLKSDSNYLQFKFHDLILYWAYDRGPKYFGLRGSYIRIPYSKSVQGGGLPNVTNCDWGLGVMGKVVGSKVMVGRGLQKSDGRRVFLPKSVGKVVHQK